MSSYWIGLFIFLSVLVIIDYVDYRNGADSLLFKSTTEIEFLNDEIRLLKAKLEKDDLEQKLENRANKKLNESGGE